MPYRSVITKNILDTNLLNDTTPAIRIGGFTGVSHQVTAVSGAHTIHQIQPELSLDNVNWITASAAAVIIGLSVVVTGFSAQFNSGNGGFQFLRYRVSVVEGAASSVQVYTVAVSNAGE